MDEIAKSAVLLSHLDPSSREMVLERLPAELRMQIERRLPKPGEIPEDELAEIVREYQSQFGSVDISYSSVAEGESPVPAPALRIDPGNESSGETLCRILQKERPALLAAVLVHLPEAIALDTFPRLPDERRRELIPLISRIGTVSPLVLHEIGLFLREKHQPVRTPPAGGLSLLARLVAADPGGFDVVVQERLTEDDRAHLARLLEGSR